MFLHHLLLTYPWMYLTKAKQFLINFHTQIHLICQVPRKLWLADLYGIVAYHLATKTSSLMVPPLCQPQNPCPKSHQDQQYFLESSYMFETGCTQTPIILDCFMNIQTDHLMILILQLILKICQTTTGLRHLRISQNLLLNLLMVLLPGHLRIC